MGILMSTTSPNMTLIIPTVGGTIGPDYALNINSDLSLLDSHDHTPGKGVQITPAGMNISTDLTFNGFYATNLAGLALTAQISPPALNTIYQSGLDLYFADGVGNQVRLTQSGGVAGTPGSIANLVAPASASYVALSSTFVWRSNTNIAANMDAGALLLRNLTPNSTFALTLQPPAGLSSNYSITLPTLPASSKIMTIANSGVISSTLDVDNTTIEISSNNLQVKDGGITGAKLASATIDTSKISGTIAIANGGTGQATANLAALALLGAFSKTANGYVSLGNGIMLQWGTFTAASPASGTVTLVTFPIAFDTTATFACAVPNFGVNGASSMYITSISNTQVQFQRSNVGNNDLGVDFYFFAVGY